MGDNYKAKDRKNFEKSEKVDTKFNVISTDRADGKIEVKAEEKPEVKTEIEAKVETKIETEIKSETKSENKPVIENKSNVSGEVICVTTYSYIIKTKDGKGILVTGKHNKKIGDIV